MSQNPAVCLALRRGLAVDGAPQSGSDTPELDGLWRQETEEGERSARSTDEREEEEEPRFCRRVRTEGTLGTIPKKKQNVNKRTCELKFTERNRMEQTHNLQETGGKKEEKARRDQSSFERLNEEE